MTRPFLLVALLLASPALAAPPATEIRLTLKVVSVHDGDTFTGIDQNNEQVKVRLAAVDAPKLSQPYGQASRKALGDKIFGKVVTVITKKHDRCGRIVGHVLIDKRDVISNSSKTVPSGTTRRMTTTSGSGRPKHLLVHQSGGCGMMPILLPHGTGGRPRRTENESKSMVRFGFRVFSLRNELLCNGCSQRSEYCFLSRFQETLLTLASTAPLGRLAPGNRSH